MEMLSAERISSDNVGARLPWTVRNARWPHVNLTAFVQAVIRPEGSMPMKSAVRANWTATDMTLME